MASCTAAGDNVMLSTRDGGGGRNSCRFVEANVRCCIVDAPPSIAKKINDPIAVEVDKLLILQFLFYDFSFTYRVTCTQTVAYICQDLSANRSKTKPLSDPYTYNTLTVAHCICRYSLYCKPFLALTAVRYVSANSFHCFVASLPIVDRVRIDIGPYPFRPYFNLSLRHRLVMHKYSICT